MKDTLKIIFVVMVLAVVGAIVAPFVIMAQRIAATWTADSTNQLLGGALTCLGGVGIMLALMVGAGAFARLTGGRAPRPEPNYAAPLPPPPPEAGPGLPPGWADRLPPPVITGGGNFNLLTAGQPDSHRYAVEVERGGKP
jgi:hypothetical protein